jgi:hypothetical protein
MPSFQWKRLAIYSRSTPAILLILVGSSPSVPIAALRRLRIYKRRLTMYKLTVVKLTKGWVWRFYRNNVCIAKSSRGYVNHYNARRAFGSFKNVHALKDHTTEIVKSKRKVP